MTQPACQHKRTQLIAKDKDAQYEECLDCGEILEAGESGKEGRRRIRRIALRRLIRSQPVSRAPGKHPRRGLT